MSDDAAHLRRLIQDFVRAFGLLSDSRTPCDKPLPVSYAHALMFLLERGAEPPTQGELARALNVDKSNAARLCAKMEKAGHVRRARCAEDGRAFRLSLTPSGVRLAKRVDAASRDRFDKVLSALPRAELAPVLAALSHLNGAIRAIEEKP